MGLACYKVGLDRHLIRTVFVANLVGARQLVRQDG